MGERPNGEKGVELSFAEKGRFVKEILGSRLATFIALKDPQVENQQLATEDYPVLLERTDPPSEAVERIDNTYEILQMLLKLDSPNVVRAWFIGMNPQLNDQAPARVLIENPDAAKNAANHFAAYG